MTDFSRGVLRFLPSVGLVCALLSAQPGLAQQKNDFAGDYAGAVGPIHVKLHIVVSRDGTMSANVDSPDQGLFALPCSEISINGSTLSFTVPNVHGEWMGTMSSDHNSLAGIWKQGTPMPLNFTRIGATGPGQNPAPAAPLAPPSATQGTTPIAAAGGSQRPPCASTMGANYWDGSNWKPMIAAAHLGGDQGVSFKQGLKNPFNPRAGLTTILTFKNPAAALTLEPKPIFCVMVLPSFDPTVIVIGRVDVKKGHRELETCTGACASSARRSTDEWMPEKRVQPVDINRLSNNTVEITPKSPLQPGQYILGGPGVLIGYFDFGVSGGESQ